MFKGKSVQKFPDLDLDVFIQHIKRKSPIHPSVEWRVTIKQVLEPSQEIVGSTLVLLDNNCQQEECNLGNFVSDAIVDWHALKYENNEFWTDASIAVIQGSRLKTSIDPKVNNGQITKIDAEKVFSPAFFNINLLTLTGEEIKKMLEHSVSEYEITNNARFLQMSGLQVKYDLSRPVGQRVVDVKILCAECNVPTLEPLDPVKGYKILMQSILASGVDGYTAVFGEKHLQDLQESDAHVFIEYLKKKSPVHPAVEWRITFTEKIQDTTTTTPSTSLPSDVPPTNNPSSVEPTTATQAGSSLKTPMVFVVLTTLLSYCFMR